jgi:exonuclease SbcC
MGTKLNKIDFDISAFQNKIQELKILKVRIEGVNEKKVRIAELEKSNESFQKDIDLLEQHASSLKSSVFELGRFDNLFEKKKQEFENAMKDERLAEIKVAELKREIEVFSMQINELVEQIKKTEEIKKHLHYISELENWMNQNFIPLVSYIEKNVMVKLKSEFSQLFSEWFSMLVPDTFNVRLDDNFTPIIEQQDYELDYAYLSGGERTAIALAYRLALNQVINSLLSKIKTKDLVILDEPTDGFSEQQLDKMRNVLEELNIGQLIIVSHEQKMEGFVENVIRINKKDFSSEITK